MNAQRRAHIEEQRFLQVLAENVGMTAAESDHLAQCAQCRSVAEGLRADLQTLRRASQQLTPKRTRRVILPASVAPARLGGLPRRWPIAAGAVATLCLAAVLWWPSGSLNLKTAPSDLSRPVAVTPDPVMLETRMLAENALPADYQAIVESLDDSFDQGFIDFVIPPLDDKPLSRTGPYKESPYA
jgi:hypothetical protein